MLTDKQKEKKIQVNRKQKERYNKDIEYRKKKQDNARKYYENKKIPNFEITFSFEPKKISFN